MEMKKPIQEEESHSELFIIAIIMKILIIIAALALIIWGGFANVFAYIPGNVAIAVIAFLAVDIPWGLILVAILLILWSLSRDESEKEQDGEDSDTPEESPNLFARWLVRRHDKIYLTILSLLGFIGFFLIAMVFEELVFRVLLFDLIVRLNPANLILMAMISSLFFGFLHYKESPWGKMAVVSSTLTGFWFCFMYVYGGFWFSLIAHTLWDTQIFVYFFIISLMKETKKKPAKKVPEELSSTATQQTGEKVKSE